jgi:hypothetical protein
MKITQSAISFDKALSQSSENSFELQDVTPLVARTQVQPKLLSALLGATSNAVFLETNVFKYDELQDSIQLPSGKRFDEYGSDLQKDKARQLLLEVGSFGLRSNVAPKDYANKRVPGTTDTLMDESYLVSKMNSKSAIAWNQLEELAMRELLVNDTNLTSGGPSPVYSYHQDLLGTARPVTSINISGTTDNVFQLFAHERDQLMQDLEKTFNSSGTVVCICGSTFFNNRLEVDIQEGLARDLKSSIDLASMAVPTSDFGSGSGLFQYQWFDSIDGIRYIRYEASIQGTRLIPADKGYLIPLGAETFIKKVYAPAQTRQFVNTTAQPMYGWSKEDDRNGVTMWTESNFLPVNVNPQLIREITDTSGAQ